jgi:hypothetical protein
LPATLVEFTLDGAGGLDFFDVSLVDGYNLPMRVAPRVGPVRIARPLAAWPTSMTRAPRSCRSLALTPTGTWPARARAKPLASPSTVSAARMVHPTHASRLHTLRSSRGSAHRLTATRTTIRRALSHAPPPKSIRGHKGHFV